MSKQPDKPSTPDPAKIIDAQWRSYLRSVMPANAGANQVVETRRAFYAGAAALYFSIMTGLDGGTEETPGDMEMIASIARELQEFRP